jgi:hypothetical protein
MMIGIFMGTLLKLVEIIVVLISLFLDDLFLGTALLSNKMVRIFVKCHPDIIRRWYIDVFRNFLIQDLYHSQLLFILNDFLSLRSLNLKLHSPH